MRARKGGGVSLHSNLASGTAETGGPVPGAAAADSLCLLGARFQVRAHWRNVTTGEHGSGQAIPSTDETGMFWFFSAANVELNRKGVDDGALEGLVWRRFVSLHDLGYLGTLAR